MKERRRENSSLVKYMEELSDDYGRNKTAEAEIYTVLLSASKSIQKFAEDFNADDVSEAETKLYKDVKTPRGQQIISALIDIIVQIGVEETQGVENL